MTPWAFTRASLRAMGLHCKRRHGRRENTGSCKLRPAGPACAEARPFQLLPQLRQPDARFTLQNGLQDLRLLFELQRLLLRNTHHGGTERSQAQQALTSLFWNATSIALCSNLFPPTALTSSACLALLPCVALWMSCRPRRKTARSKHSSSPAMTSS